MGFGNAELPNHGHSNKTINIGALPNIGEVEHGDSIHKEKQPVFRMSCLGLILYLSWNLGLDDMMSGAVLVSQKV